MTTALRYTLLSDGPSDAALIPVLSWLLRVHLPSGAAVEQGQVADFGRLPDRIRPDRADLAARMGLALEFSPCDVLFVHRDAEQRGGYTTRRAEVETARVDAGLDVVVIPVVPVRMTEAWLLHDPSALRRAAGRPDGTSSLDLPSRNQVERVDAKARLFEALRRAAELTGRRAKRFSRSEARARLATLIDDYSPLRRFDSFQDLERDVAAFCSTWVPSDA